ncbi:MAG: hypothetical protein KF734_11140 [Saprospiraceae bacterium]|nr:hypothetical protein [Saprospiraceae bacterium]
MRLSQIIEKVTDKSNFQSLDGYIEFCANYLDFIRDSLQAVIVSQNENHYHFYQYDQKGNFQITRPINSNLMLDADSYKIAATEFVGMLGLLATTRGKETIAKPELRPTANRVVYTIQQSVGAALDDLPAGKSNTARKLNGDLFEQFVRLIIKQLGIECKAGVVQVPVLIDGQEAFKMSYQHDLIIKRDSELKVLGSVKTSSKDRLDKIFIDKFLYNRLTSTNIPHIAVFLNDVRRKNTKRENEYGINSTFLPGHFKGYTVKLNPLDGVYYCDIRPNMVTEAILKDHIKTFDRLIFEDIWRLLQ